ncbi:MAG: hypothetical protein R3315_11910 [Woeseiaceae bacterium]|nr:hypothetical protein [Woeseiaceae bacterium]
MDGYAILLFVHVLLFVFWLGTDVGVFLAAKISEKSELSSETRATVLGLGMVLDRLPRSALTLIVPTGLQLGAMSGRLDIDAQLLAGVWIVSLLWLAVLWAGFLRPHTVIEQRAMLINFAMNAIAAIVVTGGALYLLFLSDTPFWFDLKLLLVGLIFVLGVALDLLFKPAVGAFTEIVTEGGSPERDRRYSAAIAPVYRIVLAIYALVAVAAWFGLAKPTF